MVSKNATWTQYSRFSYGWKELESGNLKANQRFQLAKGREGVWLRASFGCGGA